MLTERDVDSVYLDTFRIAVLGYGSQGRSQALNMLDSGCSVVVGLRPESPRRGQAESDGVSVLDIRSAAKASNVIFFLTPDETHSELFGRYVEPVLESGDMLVFAHGFSLHYGLVRPGADVDVVLVAPKGIGPMVRETYLQGHGVPGLVAVHNDATGQARQKALELCRALGFLRCGVLETTVGEETEVDLFTEQVVLCGGLVKLIETAFETLVEAGYRPEMAYFECLHEVKLIADMLNIHGVSGMRDRISSVALHGDLFAGPRVVGEPVRDEMKTLLAEIRDGSFFKDYMNELAAGRKRTAQMVEKNRQSLLESTGRRIRKTILKTNKQD